MNSIAFAILALIGLVAFNNYRNGTLPQWLGAKFLNKTANGTSAATEASDDGSPFSISSAFLTPSTPTTSTATGLGGAIGSLLTPVVGTITGLFGEKRATHNHAGIDFAAPSGTSVSAARGGTVSYVGNLSGYGLTVDVTHGSGYVTRYAHLSSIDTKIGDAVGAGALIGKVGSTGNSTGPHLHFELRKNGSAVDPSSYLSTPKAAGAVLAGL